MGKLSINLQLADSDQYHSQLSWKKYVSSPHEVYLNAISLLSECDILIVYREENVECVA